MGDHGEDFYGDARVFLEGGWGYQLWEHLAAGEDGALVDEAVGGGAAGLDCFFGVGLREGRGEDEAGEAMGELVGEGHGDLSAHGEAGDDGFGDVEVVEEGVDVGRHGLEGGGFGGRDFGCAVAADVVGDDAVLSGEGGYLRVPHGLIEGVTVDEEDRHATACVAVGERDSIDAGGGHAFSVPTPCGCAGR